MKLRNLMEQIVANKSFSIVENSSNIKYTQLIDWLKESAQNLNIELTDLPKYNASDKTVQYYFRAENSALIMSIEDPTNNKERRKYGSIIRFYRDGGKGGQFVLGGETGRTPTQELIESTLKTAFEKWKKTDKGRNKPLRFPKDF